MGQSSKVRQESNERLREQAAELEAEADYRLRLSREGQPSHVDLGAAASGLGVRRLRERAARLREQAAA